MGDPYAARCDSREVDGTRCLGHRGHGGLHWGHKWTRGGNNITITWGKSGPLPQHEGEELVPWPPEDAKGGR